MKPYAGKLGPIIDIAGIDQMRIVDAAKKHRLSIMRTNLRLIGTAGSGKTQIALVESESSKVLHERVPNDRD